MSTVRSVLRPLGLPLKRLGTKVRILRLRWVYLREDIDGVEQALRHLRDGHADVLRAFGAKVAEDANIVGPISLVNAKGDFSNLVVGPRAHVGSEVFLDLAERVTIESGATVSMRTTIITHFDVGRGPLVEQHPRQTGAVTIGEGAYLGAGATVLHGVRVGKGAMVSAGAVVHKDVGDGGRVTQRGQSARRPDPT